MVYESRRSALRVLCAAAMCWLIALSTVSGQGATCIWDEETPGCVGIPAGVTTPAEITEAVEAIGAVSACSDLLAVDAEGLPTGCTADSTTCESVTFSDLPGAGVCSPVGNTWTTFQDYFDTLTAWNDCLEGFGTSCEQAGQDYYSKATGCTTCGGTAYLLITALEECGAFTSSATCEAGSTGGTTTAPTSEGTTTTAPTPEGTTSTGTGVSTVPQATGDLEATCVWGTSSCIALPTGTDGQTWFNNYIEFLECFELNESGEESLVVTASGCPASAPATCKTFFEDTAAPWCLPASGTWTTPSEFSVDIAWFTTDCPTATPTCSASIKSFFTNVGCPECADEGVAWLTAFSACYTAETELECTPDLAQEGTATLTSPPVTTTDPPTTSPTTVISPSPTAAVEDTELTFGGGDSATPTATSTTGTPTTTTTTTDADESTDATSTEPTETPESGTRSADGLFPDPETSGVSSEPDSNVITDLPSAAPPSMRSGVMAAVCTAVIVLASIAL